MNTGETNGKPGDSQRTPPNPEGNTPPEPSYTQTQVDSLIKKAVTKTIDDKHAELTAAGRDDKSLKAREDAVTTRESIIFEQLKDKPEAIDWHQKAVELGTAQRDLERTKQDYDGKIKAADEATRDLNIWKIAAARTNDPQQMTALFDSLNELGLSDVEQLEKIADKMGGTAPATSMEPDSAMTTGSKKKSLGDMSADEKLNEGFATLTKKK